MRLGDDRALGHPYHALAFAQDHFHDLRVFVLHLGNMHSEGRGGHRMELHQLPFGLRDDLLGYHQDIAASEGKLVSLRGLDDELGEIHARCDVWQTLQSDDTYVGSHAEPSLLPCHGLYSLSLRDERALESLYAAQ